MPVKVDLPKEIVVYALKQAIQLRSRGITAATNSLIKQALEDERAALVRAADTVTEVK